MEPQAKSQPKSGRPGRWVQVLNLVCFVLMVAMWIGVDMNGSFMGINEPLSLVLYLGVSGIGLAADVIVLLSKPRARFIALALALFYVFGIFDAVRAILSDWL